MTGMPKGRSGLSQERLAKLKKSIENDLHMRRYLGAVIAAARGGDIGFFEAIGYGDREGENS